MVLMLVTALLAVFAPAILSKSGVFRAGFAEQTVDVADLFFSGHAEHFYHLRHRFALLVRLVARTFVGYQSVRIVLDFR